MHRLCMGTNAASKDVLEQDNDEGNLTQRIQKTAKQWALEPVYCTKNGATLCRITLVVQTSTKLATEYL